jgi:hypothetical protein
MKLAGEFSSQWTDEKFVHYFKSENLKGRDHLGELGVDGGLVLKCTRAV